MDTILTKGTTKVVISRNKPTVMIGERINPTGKKKLMDAIKADNTGYVLGEAAKQLKAGAEVLDVNVMVPGTDEAGKLCKAVGLLQQEYPNTPLCIDTSDINAMEAALEVYDGKALVNSVNGTEKSLKTVLPLVKKYNAAVIGLPMDETGIPKSVDKRMEIVARIINTAESIGVSRENIIIDCLALSVSVEQEMGLVALETIRESVKRFGVNITIGASNISFGLPDRHVFTSSFLSMALAAGVTCPIVDPTVKPVKEGILTTDVLIMRDRRAKRYLAYYRSIQKEITG